MCRHQRALLCSQFDSLVVWMSRLCLTGLWRDALHSLDDFIIHLIARTELWLGQVAIAEQGSRTNDLQSTWCRTNECSLFTTAKAQSYT